MPHWCGMDSARILVPCSTGCGWSGRDDPASHPIRTVHSGRLAPTTELMSIINDDPPELSPQELQVLYRSVAR